MTPQQLEAVCGFPAGPDAPLAAALAASDRVELSSAGDYTYKACSELAPAGLEGQARNHLYHLCQGKTRTRLFQSCSSCRMHRLQSYWSISGCHLHLCQAETQLKPSRGLQARHELHTSQELLHFLASRPEGTHIAEVSSGPWQTQPYSIFIMCNYPKALNLRPDLWLLYIALRVLSRCPS